MTECKSNLLLAGICDFGWGSLGKFRLILDHLQMVDVALFGNLGINNTILEFLGTRHPFVSSSPETADVALVINDPEAADRVAALGVPVIYVDSLPYLWMTEREIPKPQNIAYYCAQVYPSNRLPLAPPLKDWNRLCWIEPIVPKPGRRTGGRGIVINLGGLHSHLVGDTVDAYVKLVLFPLIEIVRSAGQAVAAVCGNLPEHLRRRVQQLLPECQVIGRLSPYDFERVICEADLLMTSPGSTTILQASVLNLPTLLLPPQNLSQILNARLYADPQALTMQWPSNVLDVNQVESLRPQGEDAVLTFIYDAIKKAASNDRLAIEVKSRIEEAFDGMPAQGVLDPTLSRLGTNGAAQVARLVKQAIFAPIHRAHANVPRPSGESRLAHAEVHRGKADEHDC